MPHFRKQIRDSVKARLTAVLAAADMGHVKIYSGRLVSLRAAACPVINIVTSGSIVNTERENVERHHNSSATRVLGKRIANQTGINVNLTLTQLNPIMRAAQ